MDYVEEVALAAFTSPPEEQAAAADGDKKPAASDDEAEDDAPKCGDKKPAASAENTGEDDDRMCVVCLVERKDQIFVPCFHLCACEGCADEIKNTENPTCPMCRAPFASVNKVFS
jgi:hypothetical protein